MNTRTQLGFALIELMLVLTIVALLLTSVTPLLSERIQTTKLKALAHNLVSDLRDLRSRSVSEGRIYTLNTVDKGSSYQAQPGDHTIKLPNSVYIELSIDKPFDPLGKNSLYFYPDGSSNGGTVTLRREKQAYAINVNWLTGEISNEPSS